MRIVCNRCRAVYSIDDALIKSPATKARCPACGLVQPAQATEENDTTPAAADGASADAAPASPPPLPSAPAAPAVARCSRCASPLEAGHDSGLCYHCRQLDARLRLPGEIPWRVRKSDGSILGPFSTADIREKYGSGEIGAADMLARGEEDFRLMSSFPEFAHFFRRPGENYRPVRPRRGWGKLLLGLLAALLVLGAAAAVSVWKLNQPTQLPNSPMEEMRQRFAREVGTPSGSAEEMLARAKKVMERDERLSYFRADQLLKSALVLDPYNLEAGALWVKNRALIDLLLGDAGARKTALDFIDILLAQKSDDPALLRARAYLLLAAGQSGEARQLAERLAAASQNPENELLLAMSLMDTATELALEKLDALRKIQPHMLLISRLMGKAYLRLGRFHAAREVLEKRLSRNPGQLEIMVEVGRLYLQVGEFKAARETFENILAADKSNLEATLLASRILSQFERQPQPALQQLKKFAEENAQLSSLDRSALLAETALNLRLLGRLSESSAAAASALELDANNGAALFHLSLAEHLQGKPVPLEHWQEVQSHFPALPRIRAWTAQRWAASSSVKARDEFISLAQTAGEDIESILLTACFLASLDDLSQTYAWLKKAMGANPFYRDWYFGISPLYDRDVFLQAAEKWAQAAVQRFEHDPLLASLYAWVLLYQDKLQPAQDWFTRALEDDADCFPANLGAGLAAWKRGQTARAISYWQEACSLEPSQPVAASLLALAVSRAGNSNQAEKLLSAALEASPGHRLSLLVQAENWLAAKKNRRARDSLLQLYQTDGDNLYLKSLIYKLEK